MLVPKSTSGYGSFDIAAAQRFFVVKSAYVSGDLGGVHVNTVATKSEDTEYLSPVTGSLIVAFSPFSVTA